MKNKIEDLNNHLFAQLERLSDDEAMKNPIKLDKELKRAKAIAEISQVLVNGAKVQVEYVKAKKKFNAPDDREDTDDDKFITESSMLDSEKSKLKRLAAG